MANLSKKQTASRPMLTPRHGLRRADWADKVGAAITNLEIKIDRVLEPDQALAIIAMMWWKES
jgi:hypothetical protein